MTISPFYWWEDFNRSENQKIQHFMLDAYEEIGITVALENSEPFFIYDNSNHKSLRHLAVCFPIEMDELIQLHLDAHELVLNKGKSKSGKFNDVRTLEYDKMESWSRLLADKFFPSFNLNGTRDENRQMTIDDFL